MHRFVLFCILAFCGSLCFAQPTSNQSQCSSCESIFVLTDSVLWKVSNGGTNRTQCAVGFSYATGLAVGNLTGTMFVSDRGDRSIWSVSADCATKTLILKNDANATSWLFPNELAFDELNSVLYVSMFDIDPLWIAYPTPRNIIAREKHVYALQLANNGNSSSSALQFNGSFVILSWGVNNGLDISSLRMVNGVVYGIRGDRFISTLINNVWYDYLGPYNMFIPRERVAKLQDIDADWNRCGFLATAAPLDNQAFLCSSQNDVSYCDGHCDDFLPVDDFFGGVISGDDNSNSSSNSSSNTNNFDSATLLPFLPLNMPIQISETGLSGTASPLILSPPSTCGGIMFPSSVLIDCSCRVIMGNMGANRMLTFPVLTNGTAQTQGFSVSLGDPLPASDVVFELPINKMVSFVDPQCSGST